MGDSNEEKFKINEADTDNVKLLKQHLSEIRKNFKATKGDCFVSIGNLINTNNENTTIVLGTTSNPAEMMMLVLKAMQKNHEFAAGVMVAAHIYGQQFPNKVKIREVDIDMSKDSFIKPQGDC